MERQRRENKEEREKDTEEGTTISSERRDKERCSLSRDNKSNFLPYNA